MSKTPTKLSVVKGNESKFKIEKGVPLPRPRIDSSGFPFDEMEVGDSFALEKRELTRARSIMKDKNREFIAAGKTHRFVSRTFQDGARIWLLEDQK